MAKEPYYMGGILNTESREEEVFSSLYAKILCGVFFFFFQAAKLKAGIYLVRCSFAVV